MILSDEGTKGHILVHQMQRSVKSMSISKSWITGVENRAHISGTEDKWPHTAPKWTGYLQIKYPVSFFVSHKMLLMSPILLPILK